MCLLQGKSSAEEPEKGKESLEHSSNESQDRQNRSVAQLSYRQSYHRSFYSEKKTNGRATNFATGIAERTALAAEVDCGGAASSIVSQLLLPAACVCQSQSMESW